MTRAGFPNGRRVSDDVVTVELRAIAGLTIPLADPSFEPDTATAAIKDGTSNTNSDYLASFPYLGTPAGGYLHSAVFFEVPQGNYELYVRPDGPVELTVDVTGGVVTEADWPQ